MLPTSASLFHGNVRLNKYIKSFLYTYYLILSEQKYKVWLITSKKWKWNVDLGAITSIFVPAVVQKEPQIKSEPGTPRGIRVAILRKRKKMTFLELADICSFIKTNPEIESDDMPELVDLIILSGTDEFRLVRKKTLMCWRNLYNYSSRMFSCNIVLVIWWLVIGASASSFSEKKSI